MRVGCAEATHCTEKVRPRIAPRPLNAAGVHPASNRFAYLASHFVNNLRPVLGKMAAGGERDDRHPPERGLNNENPGPQYRPAPPPAGDRKALTRVLKGPPDAARRCAQDCLAGNDKASSMELVRSSVILTASQCAEITGYVRISLSPSRR